jgi:hypothetical protein
MRPISAVVLLLVAHAATASAQPAGDVRVPPIELTTAFSYDVQRAGTADLPGGPGTIVAVAGNLDPHVAIAAQISESPRMRTVMAGARLTTGFFREGRGGPGRFFAQWLAGSRRGGTAGDGAAFQAGIGADVIVVPRGLSLHWGLDYLFTPGARQDFAGARFCVGLVAGPHVKRA